MKVIENRTEAYVCSIDPRVESDMRELEVMRKVVSKINARNKRIDPERLSRYVVTVKGREPITKQAYHNRWTGKTGSVGYTWAGDIVGNKYTNAKRLDIYLHTRIDWK